MKSTFLLPLGALGIAFDLESPLAGKDAAEYADYITIQPQTVWDGAGIKDCGEGRCHLSAKKGGLKYMVGLDFTGSAVEKHFPESYTEKDD